MRIIGKIMAKRSSHTGKSSKQKEYYMRQLGSLGYEPTVEEEPVFPISDSLPVAEDFERESTPKRVRRRPQSATDKIANYFKKNWVNWLIPIVVAFLVLFAYNISKDVGNLQGVVGEIKDAVNSFKTQLQNIENKIHEQDLELQKQGIEMEHIEEDLQELDKRLPPQE